MYSSKKPEAGRNEAHAPEGQKTTKKTDKERAERRQINKNIQSELTSNIALAYQTIRPTMIQAQRILKIIDNLKEKFLISGYLDFDFMKLFESQTALNASGLNLSEVAKLSGTTKDYLKKLARIQNQINEILVQDIHSVSEAGEEEEDHSKRDDSEDDPDKEPSVKEVNQEEEQLKREREGKVLELRSKMEGDYKNLVRHLERSEHDMEIIKVPADHPAAKQGRQPVRVICRLARQS